jgi:hypothetical protein
MGDRVVRVGRRGHEVMPWLERDHSNGRGFVRQKPRPVSLLSMDFRHSSAAI